MVNCVLAIGSTEIIMENYTSSGAAGPREDQGPGSFERDGNSAGRRLDSTAAAPAAVTAERALEEIDVWWGSYAGRKMVPGFVLSGLLTAVFFGLAWYFREWHGNVVRYWVQVAMGGLWTIELAWWVYRLVSAGYRLTTRRLLYYWGLFRPIRLEVDLKDVTQVIVEQKPLDRLLGVGRLRIATKDKPHALIFEAVTRPLEIANKIERRISRAAIDRTSP
jgi:hypothetical protein